MCSQKLRVKVLTSNQFIHIFLVLGTAFTITITTNNYSKSILGYNEK